MPSRSMSAPRAATLGLTIVVAGCAGDDGDDDTGAASTDASPTTNGDTSATTGPEASTGTPGSDGTSGSTGAADSTGPGATTAGDSTGTEGESSGGFVEPIELSNDGWFEGVPAIYMGGFVQQECWASTFVPEPEHYPFVVDATRLLVGGTNRGTADFTLGLWSVDENNQPDTELSSAVVELTGINKDIDTVLLGIAGIESPVFDEGNFALVGCLEAHDGFPAIAADNDGQVDFQDRNWIRDTDGNWAQSSALGVGGDWIMRAFILPSG